ncbi:MAG TPA: hemerythrin domain-containing protein [Acidimicrobiia bacterium]|jgi:hemerythrin superfamily protein
MAVSTKHDSAVDVIDAILEDHRRIKELMSEVDAAPPDGRDEPFQRLVAMLAVHETAEEEVVHPLARKASGGDAIVEARLAEEAKGKEALARLEKTGPQRADFDELFEQLRDDVLAHAEHEETEEHPKLREATDAQRRRDLTRIFRAAESTAPTHGHAHAPESATGNMLVGPFVAIADRARDAIRKARDGGDD